VPNLAHAIGCSSLLALALVACSGPEDPDGGVTELEASLAADLNTVVQLSWSSDLPGDSWVEYAAEGQPALITPVVRDSTDHHHAELLGLPPFSAVHFQVFTDEGDAVVTAEGDIQTAGLPAELPDFDAMFHKPEAVSPEPWIAATIIGDNCWVVILDRDGTVLWYRDVDVDPRLLPMSIERDPAGPSLRVGRFFIDFPTMAKDPECPASELLGLDMLAQDLEAIDLGVAHHDMVTLPDGTVATIGLDVRPWYDPDRDEEVLVVADTLVEVDPDGGRHEVFSAWDWGEPQVHERFYQVREDIGDWTHGNGLHYDPATDSYLLSLGMINTVLRIERGTGSVLQAYGDAGWPVTEGMGFYYQHDPHWTEQGTLLMSSWVGPESRVMAIEYEVDEEQGELREIWSYGKDEGFTSIAGGQVLRLDNGNTLLNTGYRGLLVEVTPEGQPVWELAAQAGSVFGEVIFFEDLYGAD
jgi:hypothetical protein